MRALSPSEREQVRRELDAEPEIIDYRLPSGKVVQVPKELLDQCVISPNTFIEMVYGAKTITPSHYFAVGSGAPSPARGVGFYGGGAISPSMVVWADESPALEGNTFETNYNVERDTIEVRNTKDDSTVSIPKAVAARAKSRGEYINMVRHLFEKRKKE